MYKITLYDYNCSPICDGVVCFFADDIEDFQEKWLASGDVDSDRKERFLRSKAGEIVTDYYSDAPELNIVQHDKETVFGEKKFTLENVTFEAFNIYDYPTKFHIDKWDIHFKWIRFSNEYFRIASYKAMGVCRYVDFFNRWEDVMCYGNPVLENTVGYRPEDKNERPEFNSFAENSIETICFLTNYVFENEQELQDNISHFEITDKMMDWLFSDVVGEAG